MFNFTQNWDELIETEKEMKSNELKNLIKFVDLYNSEIPEIVKELTGSSISEEHADVILTTGHKSKGREWDEVEIGEDFFLPKKRVQDEEGNSEEVVNLAAIKDPELINLFYVAVTRAKKKLLLNADLDLLIKGGVLVQK
jgi:F-box protein 18 (helicase)